MGDGASTADGGDGPMARGLRFLARNWQGILVDVVVVTAWVYALYVWFERAGWPPWAYYVLLVVGIVAYSLTTGSWR